MTLFKILQSLGLPVISATEDGAISMGKMTAEQERLYSQTVHLYFASLDDIKAETIAKIDRTINTQRDDYITAGFGQQRVYDAKMREIEIYKSALAKGETSPRLPYAEQRAKLYGVTVPDVIAEWGKMIAELDEMYFETESLREKLKKQVSDCKSKKCVEASLKAFSVIK